MENSHVLVPIEWLHNKIAWYYNALKSFEENQHKGNEYRRLQGRIEAVEQVAQFEYINPSTQQQRINELEQHLKILVEGYEQWEADIISDDKLWWPHSENDAIRGKLYDDMMLLQEKRNEAKAALNQQNSNK